jgi:outer membrane protein, adhesin transport system
VVAVSHKPSPRFVLALSLGLLIGAAATLPAGAQRNAPSAAPMAPPPPPPPTRCLDESASESATDAADTSAPSSDPRAVLQGLVREALSRSNQVGAAQLLAEAAAADVEQTRAATLPQATLDIGAGPGGRRDALGTAHASSEGRASIGVSQLIWDGQRSTRLADWRERLADAAQQSALSSREQLALATVSLSLERARFRQHVVVYAQYVRKMGCLVDSLDTLVRADRGRASELVQARKSLQQAEIAQAQAQSQARQVEVRLRRLVGDGLPDTRGIGSVLLAVGDVQQLVADVDTSADIAALTAQADAASRLAEATALGNRPRLSWNANASASGTRGGSIGSSKQGTWSAGLTLNVPLWDPSVKPATDAARKRARAAELQRAEILEQRRFRVAEVHEQTTASFDRARRVAAVLRDTDQLRNFTLLQWQQLGRRSLFDVISAEAEHYNLRISYINALTDGQQLNASLLSLGRGVGEWLK